MVKHAFYGYGLKALRHDPAGTGFQIDLRGQYQAHRRLFECLGPAHASKARHRQAGPAGAAQNHFGKVYDSRHRLIAQGRFQIEWLGQVRHPDGGLVSIDRISIDGRPIGIVTSVPLAAGLCYACATSNDDPVAANPAETAVTVAALGPGAMVMTDRGEIPVEWLQSADRVLTRDNRFQPILRLARARLTASYFQQRPDDCPLRLPAGALGQGAPSHDLHLACTHRILLRSHLAQAVHGATDVLAPARAWADLGRAEVVVPQAVYTLTHLLFASREVVLAEGTWIETGFLDRRVRDRFGPDDLSDLWDLRAGPQTAQARPGGAPSACPDRPRLTRSDAHLLIEQSRDGASARLPATVVKRAS